MASHQPRAPHGHNVMQSPVSPPKGTWHHACASRGRMASFVCLLWSHGIIRVPPVIAWHHTCASCAPQPHTVACHRLRSPIQPHGMPTSTVTPTRPHDTLFLPLMAHGVARLPAPPQPHGVIVLPPMAAWHGPPWSHCILILPPMVAWPPPPAPHGRMPSRGSPPKVAWRHPLAPQGLIHGIISLPLQGRMASSSCLIPASRSHMLSPSCRPRVGCDCPPPGPHGIV